MQHTTKCALLAILLCAGAALLLASFVQQLPHVSPQAAQLFAVPPHPYAIRAPPATAA